MKILLDIKENKVEFLLELLRNFKFVNKVETLDDDGLSKKQILDNIREAVEELNLIKEKKLTARNAEEIFNEL